MEIDFVRKKGEVPRTSIATVRCKIKNLVIPASILDSGAEVSIMSEDIAKRLKLNVNTDEKYDLSGAATITTESLGTTPKIPILFLPDCTLSEKFVVIKHHKPLLAFSNPFIKKHKCIIDWDKDELKMPLDGKEYVIPVTMHRVSNKLEVNCVSKDTDSGDDEELKKSCVNALNLEYSHKTKREEELEKALNKNIESLYVITECYNGLLTRVENTVSGKFQI